MNNGDVLEKIIKEMYCCNRLVCIFGTGKVGMEYGYKYIKMLVSNGMRVDYFCDNNSEKWGNVIIDGIKCISPEELYAIKNPLVFLLISPNNSKTVEQQLENSNIEYITYDQLRNEDIFVDIFLNTKDDSNQCKNAECPTHYNVPQIKNRENKRIAVYTCITGNYDKLQEPTYINDQCDYFVITDSNPCMDSKWKYINIDEVLPDIILSDVKKNRFCKIHGCELFAEYEYSIYIDGNMQIKGDLSNYIDKIGRSGIGLFGLPGAGGDCIYLHGVQIAGTRAPVDIIRRQLNMYMSEGMPRHYGAFECNFIVRDNNNELTQKLMRDWWKEVYEKSWRDQISFMYVIWKNGLTAEDVGLLGTDVRKIHEISRISHE